MNIKPETKPPNILLLAPPIIAATVIGLGCGLLALGISLRNDSSYPKETALIWAGAGIILGFVWGSLAWSQRLSNLYTPRKFESTVKKEQVRIELAHSSGSSLSVEYIDFPPGITMKHLKEMAKLIVANDFIMASSIPGKSKLISRSDYETIRDMLVARGLAMWKNPRSHNQGLLLLGPGRSMFSQLATHDEGPLPKITRLLGTSQTHTNAQETI